MQVSAPTMRRAAAFSRGTLRVSAVARPTLVPSARRSSVTAKSVGTATLEATAAVETTTTTITAGVHVLTPETFESFIQEHSEKTVVVDFYTDWCGPCKMVAPQLEQMAGEADPTKLMFAKLNCGKDNDSKRLAMNLKIKALPTFKLYKKGQEVDMMTGAKVKALQELISKHVA